MRIKTLLMTAAGLAMGALLCASPALAVTYYVNGTTGSNTNTCEQATSPTTPKKTIGKGPDALTLDGGIQCAVAGDTVIVAAGTYAESVESKRDGSAGSPIVIKAETAGTAIVQAPAGTNGFVISHNYNTIDGFTINVSRTGIQAGFHDGSSTAPVIGVLIQNNTVTNAANNGIQVPGGLNVEIAFNTVQQSGKNGIVHNGNASLIHDNLVKNNGQFGIYVKDGVDHQVYDNVVTGNADGNLQIVGTLAPTPALTYYVDCLNGNDQFTPTQAKNPASPWKTVKTALNVVDGGDTIMLLGGTAESPVVCNESTIESKRDGAAGKPITIRAATPLAVMFDPPSGNGIVITHDYHTLTGIVVTGAANGIQLGPHDGGDGPVTGLALNNVWVYGNTVAGVKFSNAVGGVVKHSLVHNNGSHGILYAGTGANITNNLVFRNGGGGDYGITIQSGSGHALRNNTIANNVSGGLRLSVSGAVPVSVTAVNNIITGSPVGIKEQGAGVSTLNFNDVWGNTSNYQLTGSAQGANSISADPRYVDGPSDDYRLGRIASGQPANSPAIDAGSDTSANQNLSTRTAFIDKLPDSGTVDLGYHGTSIFPAEATLTVSSASISFNKGINQDGFTLNGTLAPGVGSDGLGIGSDYVEVKIGVIVYPLLITGFQETGPNQWSYAAPVGSGQQATGTFLKNANGSVQFSIQVSGLTLSYMNPPISIGMTIGDDVGTAPNISMGGVLSYPN